MPIEANGHGGLALQYLIGNKEDVIGSVKFDCFTDFVLVHSTLYFPTKTNLKLLKTEGNKLVNTILKDTMGYKQMWCYTPKPKLAKQLWKDFIVFAEYDNGFTLFFANLE